MQDNQDNTSGQSQGHLLKTIFILTPMMASLVIIGSSLGLFRALEWASQDQFFRLRGDEGIDDHLAIVTIDETDIRYVERWPMSDKIFAEAIRKIRQQNPIAIGLDIYRDLPVGRGYEELNELFTNTPNLIGIRKVVGTPINPPPILEELGQVAANDLVLDADGKVRRGLLLLAVDQQDTLVEGLGARLALTYLGERDLSFEEVPLNWGHRIRQAIEDQRSAYEPGSFFDSALGAIGWLFPDPQWIYRLGKAKLVPLSSRDGDYFSADMGGYQLLLNYRGSLSKSFLTVSLQDLLEDRIPPDFLTNRLVLVGARAPSLNDNFPTPFNSTLEASAADLMPGVAIHATIASQIINAALDGRPLLRTPPKLLTWLGILLLSGYSVTVGTICVHKGWMGSGIASLIGAGGVVIAIGYFSFQGGWVVPVFTPIVAIAGAGIVSIGTALWSNLKLSYRQLEEYAQTLEDKVQERTAELADANDKISKLNEELTDENRRMGAELNVAKEMQEMILPKAEELSGVKGLDIAGYMEPAEEVGGDYYDVLSEEGLVTLSIGDVTGHGLASGLLMIMTQTAVRTLQEARERDPVRFLDIINRTLYKNVQRMNIDKSLTLVMLTYDGKTLSICGQHEETLLVRRDGTVERIDTMDLGFPIGLDDDIADFIGQRHFTLIPGEGVVLYTDGVTEAENLEGEQYEIDRLCEVISKSWQQPASGVRQAIIDDVYGHIGTQKVFDDITLLVVKRSEDGILDQSGAAVSTGAILNPDPDLRQANDEVDPDQGEDVGEPPSVGVFDDVRGDDRLISPRASDPDTPVSRGDRDLDFITPQSFARSPDRPPSPSELFGDYDDNFGDLEEEFLQLGFSPTSQPIQNRWRNHGLSADFVADYLSTFLPISEEQPENEERQAILKSSVSYIANELLENAMKFNDHQAYTVQFSIRLFLQDEQVRVVLQASNSLTPSLATKFKAFIQDFLSMDPQDFYIQQMEASAEDETGTASGLGLITMIMDHGAQLGWKFEQIPSGFDPLEDTPIVTTMVQLYL